ncbi:MAG: tetratricopeptide repeat protein, partial [Paracoccaceae bacterium]
LRSFLTDYPGSPLEGEAHYWLGESQFVRGAFQNAARSYLSGYNIDRASAIAPKNLYRLGVTLGRLGQLNEACLTLREVRRQFPTGPADILDAADAESSELNCG